ncbi:hypothetical protein ACFL7M_02425 [Thermodesulfobacteriota bacterium]
MNKKNNPKHWNVLDSSIAFENRWMKVKKDTVMLPNGKVLDDYFLWIAFLKVKSGLQVQFQQLF